MTDMVLHAEDWRELAEDMLKLAEQMTDIESKRILRSVALLFEALADRVERAGGTSTN